MGKYNAMNWRELCEKMGEYSTRKGHEHCEKMGNDTFVLTMKRNRYGRKHGDVITITPLTK